MKPTQAQIEAAANAIMALSKYGEVRDLRYTMAQAALTAAAQVTDPNIIHPGKDPDFVFPEE